MHKSLRHASPKRSCGFITNSNMHPNLYFPLKRGAPTIAQASISQHHTKGESFLRRHKFRLMLLAFLVVFALAASYNLGYMSVQWDEMPHLLGAKLLIEGHTQFYITTYGYYPPLFDLITTGAFGAFGVSDIAGRAIAATFAVLSIWLVFEFAKRVYGEKHALLAAVLLGTMPGFFWLSRVTMLETMLIFFFTLAMFAFYAWLGKQNSNKALLLSGLALGIGVLAKYQIIVAALAMLLCILFLARKRLKLNLAKFAVIIIIVVLVVMPWFAIIYHYNGMTKFETIQYVMSEGGQDRPAYSNRFQPLPIYYIAEMTWPFEGINVHPITLPVMILGLFGLGMFAYRRNKNDIFFLTWFLVIFAFFTFIPNRQWRYVTPLFPILAISATCFIWFLYGKIKAWQPKEPQINIRKYKKAASAAFILLIAGAVAYAGYESYQMTVRDQINIPVKEATAYLAEHLDANQSAVLVCSYNLLSQDMFRFYLPANMSSDQIWQYPALAVDAFKPDFDIDEFTNLCVERNVKYIILYDFGENAEFFNTTLTYEQVRQMIYDTGRFDDPNERPFWGDFYGWMGYRIFLVRFLG